jgi:hypothetical protein
VSEFRACVQEVLIAWAKLRCQVALTLCLYLQHRVSARSWRRLEEKNFGTDIFSDVICCLNCWYEARLLRFLGLGIDEVVREVFQKIQYEIKAVCQTHKQIFYLAGKVNFCRVRHYKHLRLLKSAPQIEIVKAFIISEEANPNSFVTRQCSFLQDALNRMCRLLYVTWI